MNIKINGEATTLDEAVNITGLLTIKKVKMPDMVSVELNGEILKRDDFDTTSVKDGDNIEFLYFMGGGSHNES